MLVAIGTRDRTGTTATMSHLLVNDEDPVPLNGHIDSTGSLQIEHDSDSLGDYDQELWCAHSTASSITVEIHDFVDGSTTWTVSAEHGRTAWTRESGYVWFTFTEEPTSPIEVEVRASNGADEKPRTIKIKPQPQQPTLLARASELVLGSVPS